MQQEVIAMTARQDAVRRAFLLWLDNHNSEQPNPQQFLSDPASSVDGVQVDEPELERSVRVLVARNLIKGTKAWNGSELPIRASLTTVGTLVIDEHDGDFLAWRRATGEAVVDERQRPAKIETLFLRWLSRQRELSPPPGNFRNDPTVVIDGEPVDDGELRAALAALHTRGLISDEGGLAGRLNRVDLTRDGRLCLLDHDGDVRAWRESASGGASMTVNTTGPTQAVMGSSNVTQVMHAMQAGTRPVDRAKYGRAASTLLAEVDNFDFPPKDAAKCREAAQEIIAELDQPDPDDGKLRRSASVVLQVLAAVTVATGGSVAATYIVQLLTSVL